MCVSGRESMQCVRRPATHLYDVSASHARRRLAGEPALGDAGPGLLLSDRLQHTGSLESRSGDLTWGSQSWLQPPFQAASLVVRKVLALQQPCPFRWSRAEPPRKAAARLKAHCKCMKT